MIVLRAHIFTRYPEIGFGFSTRIGLNRGMPYWFNMSKSVGDAEEAVEENRRAFYGALGLGSEQVAMQKQVHGSTVQAVTSPGFAGESDAMITATPLLGLAVSTADCVPIFVYDPVVRVIAGIHSGWRSSAARIARKTVERMESLFGCRPADLVAFIGPAAGGLKYVVQQEVADLFDGAFLQRGSNGYLLDLPRFNKGLLLHAGLREQKIQQSTFCTISRSALLHSYRAHGALSGRALGIIYMKGHHA